MKLCFRDKCCVSVFFKPLPEFLSTEDKPVNPNQLCYMGTVQPQAGIDWLKIWCIRQGTIKLCIT